MPKADEFVLFVDMLGFAALVEEHADQLEYLGPVFQAVTPVKALTASIVNAQAGPLISRFSSFHLALEKQIRAYVENGITAMTFSDSAFIRLSTAPRTVLFATQLMRAFLMAEVPVRMGISAGSFQALRFMSDNTSKANVHSSQFVGTAVVRAYKAEQCGLRGMRIFVHPSVRPHLSTPHPKVKLLRLHEARPDAYAELNYLPTTKEGMRDTAAANGYSSLRSKVSAMRLVAPPSFGHYYESTLKSLARMKADLDRLKP